MAGLIPERIIDEINSKTDILDVVSPYVNLSRKGDRWWGLCPFHNEKTPSFSVLSEKKIFYCFGCHQGGGSFKFLMEMESLTFPEAIRQLAEKVGVHIPEMNGGEDHHDNRRALGELYQRVSHTLHWLFVHHKDASHAREYLGKRGISNETAGYYEIGWAPKDGEWLYQFLLKKEYSPSFLAESGLFSKKSPRWSYFVDRLMFPVMPDRERVVAFSGRALDGKEPKYINSPETIHYVKGRHLYGFGQARGEIRKKKRVVLCEGNLDVLSCSQADVGETVAPLGTALTKDQVALIKRQTDSITLLFDGDDAGKRATVKAGILAELAGLSVNTVKMPSGSDPADFFCTKGPESLKKIIERPINIFDYLLDFLIVAKSNHSGEAQEEALKKLAPYLDAVGSEVRRENYLRKLADEINADPITVIREYTRNRGRIPLRTSRLQSMHSSSQENETVLSHVGDELYLMTAVAVKTEHFKTLRSVLAPEAFQDKRALAVYRAMDELSAEGRALRTDAIVSILDNKVLRSYILDKAATGIYDEKSEETIKEKIRLLQLRTLREERRELQKLIDTKGMSTPGLNKARMIRIVEIDKEIQAR